MEWADAWGAFEDSNDLIGACAMVQTSETAFWVHVAVVPERRRLEIANELLTLVVEEVTPRGARTLRGSYPFDAPEARQLVDCLEFTSARRTIGGRVDVVVFLPSAPSASHEPALRLAVESGTDRPTAP